MPASVPRLGAPADREATILLGLAAQVTIEEPVPEAGVPKRTRSKTGHGHRKDKRHSPPLPVRIPQRAAA